MIKTAIRSLVVMATFVAALAAHAETGPFDQDVLNVTQRLVLSMDANGDGSVTAGEHNSFSKRARHSIDANSDGKIDAGEFLAWDVGYQWIADKRGVGGDFLQVKSDLFALWDKNSDGFVDRNEMKAQTKAEFSQSDADGDQRITTEDLLNGSLTIVTLMSAV